MDMLGLFTADILICQSTKSKGYSLFNHLFLIIYYLHPCFSCMTSQNVKKKKKAYKGQKNLSLFFEMNNMLLDKVNLPPTHTLFIACN